MCFQAAPNYFEDLTERMHKAIFYKVVHANRSPGQRHGTGIFYNIGKVVHGLTESGRKVRRPTDKQKSRYRIMGAGIYVFTDRESAEMRLAYANQFSGGSSNILIEVECDLRDLIGAGRDNTRNVACFTKVKVLT